MPQNWCSLSLRVRLLSDQEAPEGILSPQCMPSGVPTSCPCSDLLKIGRNSKPKRRALHRGIVNHVKWIVPGHHFSSSYSEMGPSNANRAQGHPKSRPHRPDSVVGLWVLPQAVHPGVGGDSQEPCACADGMASAGGTQDHTTWHTLAMLRKGGRESWSLVTVEALPMSRLSHKIKKSYLISSHCHAILFPVTCRWN